jgi:thioredoxin 1
VYSALAQEHAGQAVFAKVDLDLLGEVATDDGVSAVPQFHVYKAGKLIDKVVGARADELRKLVAKHCAASGTKKAQ